MLRASATCFLWVTPSPRRSLTPLCAQPNNTTTVFTNTEAVIAFLGGTTFLIGGYLGYVESLNPAFADWDGAFAYEVEEVLGGKRSVPPSIVIRSGDNQEHTANFCAAGG